MSHYSKMRKGCTKYIDSKCTQIKYELCKTRILSLFPFEHQNALNTVGSVDSIYWWSDKGRGLQLCVIECVIMYQLNECT